MTQPRDLDALCATIAAHLQGERRASINQMTRTLALSRRALLIGLRLLARRGVVQRDPTPPLSADTAWWQGNGVPLPPRRPGGATLGGAMLQRQVAAVDSGRARRDPLVAALFGEAA